MTKFFLSLALALLSLTVSAQANIEEIWKNMPDSIIPYYNAGIRTEMADMHKINSSTNTKNLLEGNSRFVVLTDRYADICLSNSVDMKLLLLDKSDSTQTVCMVKTFGNPAVESDVAFYSTDWIADSCNYGLPDFNDAELMKKMLTEKPDTMTQERFDELSSWFEPLTVTVITKADELILEASCPLLTREERKSIKDIIKQKYLKWNGSMFK